MTFMKYSSSLKFVKNNMFNVSRLKVLFLGSLFAYLLKFITLPSVKLNNSCYRQTVLSNSKIYMYF